MEVDADSTSTPSTLGRLEYVVHPASRAAVTRRRATNNSGAQREEEVAERQDEGMVTAEAILR